MFNHLTMFCFTGFSWSADVHQTPLQVITNPGGQLNISCSQNDNNLDYMYWYRQQLGKGFQLIAYIFTNTEAEFEKDFKTKMRFEIRKPSAFYGSFIMNTLTEEDSAVYFCAASQHSDTTLPLSYSKSLKICVDPPP